MVRHPLTDWDAFKTDSRPLTNVRGIDKALRGKPGLATMYAEVKRHGTVLGIPVLSVGRNIFVPRQRAIDVVEGRDGQTEV